MEKLVIAKYKSLGHPLTNLTDGGDGFDSIDQTVRLEAFLRSTSKKVKTSLGEEFSSTAKAESWLRLNGYPKASAKAISAVALGKRNFAYGRAWSYGEEFPIHPKTTNAIEFAKMQIARPVIRSDGVVFESAHFAARCMIETTHPKACSSSIHKACKGKLKLCYGFSWRYV